MNPGIRLGPVVVPRRTGRTPSRKIWMALALAGLVEGCDRKPAPPPHPRVEPAVLTVFAAASTTDVMREAGRRYEARTGTKVVFSFDASSNLARQIKAGAPADLFLSADEAWMDDAISSGAVDSQSRRNLLGNRLVLVAPAGRRFEARMASDFDFAASLPDVRRIAVADPAHVPAGRYARQALESLGWWKGLEQRLLPAVDVRAALRLVENGEADAGIVYATDARQSQQVTVIAPFPSESHGPIRYPVALCSPGALKGIEFLNFLLDDEMAEVFQSAGFDVLARSAKESDR